MCVCGGEGDGIEHQKEKSEMTKISTMKARRPWNNISKIPVGNNNLELYSQLNYISKYGKDIQRILYQKIPLPNVPLIATL